MYLSKTYSFPGGCPVCWDIIVHHMVLFISVASVVISSSFISDFQSAPSLSSSSEGFVHFVYLFRNQLRLFDFLYCFSILSSSISTIFIISSLLLNLNLVCSPFSSSLMCKIRLFELFLFKASIYSYNLPSFATCH